MVGQAIGSGFAVARDFLARGLVRLHVTPNTLTLTGTVLTVAAGACFAIGAGDRFALTLDPHAHANAYLLVAFALLILSNACDMLDGAVARLGNLRTPFGAFLDSTLDRASDFAVFAGIALYYCRHGNITFVLLAMLAFFHSFMISYTRARAEDIIDKCRVGYWQRGERSAAVVIATAAWNIPALLIQQALLPALTVLRRIVYTQARINGRSPVVDPRQGGTWLKLQLWRWPRMTWAYDLVTALNILWLIFAPIPDADPIRAWLGL